MNSLSDIAQAVLDAALTGWVAPNPGDPARVPDVSYIEHVGRPNLGPVPDGGCARLIVHVPGLETGIGDTTTGAVPGGRSRAQPQRTVMSLVVTLQRCGAPGTSIDGTGQTHPPTDQERSDFGKALLDDLQALWAGLLTSWRAGTLPGGATTPGDWPPGAQTNFGKAVPYGPDGGIAGWTIPLSVTV